MGLRQYVLGLFRLDVGGYFLMSMETGMDNQS